MPFPSLAEGLQRALHALPHHALSRLAHRLALVRWPAFKNRQIRWVMHHYPVNLSEAVFTRPEDYADFNSFFTRALRPEARPLEGNADTLIAPVDGTIGAYGRITAGRLLRAKGWDYTVSELLGGCTARAAAFENGHFVSFYLAPHDYHRIHMPFDGTLRETLCVPGRLYSVAPYSVAHIPRLYARNERVIALFDTPKGALAVIMIGACLVGSIETVWGVRSLASNDVRRILPTTPQHYARGVEIGRFHFGSSVIVLCADPALQWTGNCSLNAPVRLGAALATLSA